MSLTSRTDIFFEIGLLYIGNRICFGADFLSESAPKQIYYRVLELPEGGGGVGGHAPVAAGG